MKVKLELNPDEALALIQICERDILFPEVSIYVIGQVEKYRYEYAAKHRQDPAPDDTRDIEGEIGFLRFKGEI